MDLKLLRASQIMRSNFLLDYLRLIFRKRRGFLSGKQSDLTAREREIIRWIAEGKSTHEISVTLNLSSITIRFHLTNIYRKLGILEYDQRKFTNGKVATGFSTDLVKYSLPGRHLSELAKSICSLDTFERILEPVLADMQLEHCESLKTGQIYRARWVHLKGCWDFWKTWGLYYFVSSVKTILGKVF